MTRPDRPNVPEDLAVRINEARDSAASQRLARRLDEYIDLGSSHRAYYREDILDDTSPPLREDLEQYLAQLEAWVIQHPPADENEDEDE